MLARWGYLDTGMDIGLFETLRWKASSYLSCSWTAAHLPTLYVCVAIIWLNALFWLFLLRDSAEEPANRLLQAPADGSNTFLIDSSLSYAFYFVKFRKFKA